MKANYIKSESAIDRAFHIRKDVRTHFDDKWHYHEVLEFVIILEGSGKRFIGDSIETFTQGDVILVGEKLPHVWRSNHAKSSVSTNTNCSAIVIQFSSDFLGKHFLDLSESFWLKELFKKAEMGISFSSRTREILIKKIKRLLILDDFERLLLFLHILNFASKSKDYRLLASPLFKETIFNADKKINRVFEFIMDNFSNTITLDQVSKIALMNKTAFCRYFKNKTKKTFTSFLNEVRIGYACKLMQDGRYNITEAAYLSGYNSPSHFNKQFRLIKKVSPSQFYNDLKEE